MIVSSNLCDEFCRNCAWLLFTYHLKLLFAKLCTCYCVWFWFGQPSLKIPWILCKMCLKLENFGRIVWKSYFWKTRLKTSVFEKHSISYSCILFIKYYTLRSFCIKLLCFSKNWFFQNFNRSNLFLDQSKLRLKFWFSSVCFDRFSIAIGAIKGIFDQSKIV